MDLEMIGTVGELNAEIVNMYFKGDITESELEALLGNKKFRLVKRLYLHDTTVQSAF